MLFSGKEKIFCEKMWKSIGNAGAILICWQPVLSTLDDLNKATQRLDALREQAKEYVDEAGKNRLAYDNAIAENKQLLARIEALEKELQNNRQTANA